LIRHSRGMAPDLDVVLGVAQLLAGGDAQLFRDNVDASDHLRYRVFHLDPGVHFNEEELTVLVQELKGSGAHIANLTTGGETGLECAFPGLRVDVGRRSLLHHFLVTALQ